MQKIILIDDDYATEVLIENLRFRGYDAERISSATEALKSIDTIVSADLVILDMIMERPPTNDKKVSGDRTTGMEVFIALREKKPELPILILTASRDKDIMETVAGTSHTDYLAKWATPSLQDILSKIQHLTGGPASPRQPKCFIVHGHDETAKLSLKNYLQNKLNLPEPIILHELPNLGRTVIEKFEDAALDVDLAFVLLTPDDTMSPSSASNDEKRRARQNVIFEMGYFLGVLGRKSGRVLLLHKGPLDIPSDLSGVIYIDISTGVESAGEQIRQEVRHVCG